MLVLSRKVGQSLVIGNVTVFVTEILRNKVKLGVSAPEDVNVARGELLERIEEERGNAAPAAPQEDEDGFDWEAV